LIATSAPSRIGDGGRSAYAGITSGDKRFAARQPTRSPIARLAVIRPRIHLARQTRPRLGLSLVRRSGIFISRVLQWLLFHRFVSLRDRTSRRCGSTCRRHTSSLHVRFPGEGGRQRRHPSNSDREFDRPHRSLDRMESCLEQAYASVEAIATAGRYRGYHGRLAVPRSARNKII
jgi:hypothetical protein